VYGPPGVLARLDYQLWAADPLEFLPHLRWRDAALPAPVLRERTQLWLLEQTQPLLRCDNAVNLGWDEPSQLTTHARVAEVVGLEAADRASGRRRWRQYEAQGHVLQHRPQS
jgi:DNA polymerase-3 subunit chi